MSDFWYSVWAVLAVAGTTMLIRAAPYLLFGRRSLPPMMDYLRAVLPAAIMVVLVVYCLRNVNFAAFPHGGAELSALALTIILHFWRKNTILSVFAGTACYMILIRTVFPM